MDFLIKKAKRKIRKEAYKNVEKTLALQERDMNDISEEEFKKLLKNEENKLISWIQVASATSLISFLIGF